MDTVMTEKNETPERRVLTPEEEATMIWSDRPVLRHFDCPVKGCDAVLPVHADVDLVLVVTEEEAAAGKIDGPMRIAFVPSIYADAFDEHLTLDHGVECSLHSAAEFVDDDEEEEEDD